MIVVKMMTLVVRLLQKSTPFLEAGSVNRLVIAVHAQGTSRLRRPVDVDRRRRVVSRNRLRAIRRRYSRLPIEIFSAIVAVRRWTRIRLTDGRWRNRFLGVSTIFWIPNNVRLRRSAPSDRHDARLRSRRKIIVQKIGFASLAVIGDVRMRIGRLRMMISLDVVSLRDVSRDRRPN